MTIYLNGSTGEVFPSWTAVTRPTSPTTGQVGYNTSFSTLEVYTGTAWYQITTSLAANGVSFLMAGGGGGGCSARCAAAYMAPSKPSSSLLAGVGARWLRATTAGAASSREAACASGAMAAWDGKPQPPPPCPMPKVCMVAAQLPAGMAAAPSGAISSASRLLTALSTAAAISAVAAGGKLRTR